MIRAEDLPLHNEADVDFVADAMQEAEQYHLDVKDEPKIHKGRTRWLPIVTATVLAAALSLTLFPGTAHAQKNLEKIKLDVSCISAPKSDYSQHARVSIAAEVEPASSPSRQIIDKKPGGMVYPTEVNWLTVYDPNTSRRFVLTYGDITHPKITATLDGRLNSIRKLEPTPGQTQKMRDEFLLRPFTTYTVSVSRGAFTTWEYPHSYATIAENAFSANCPGMPDWSLPGWVKDQLKPRKTYPQGVYAV